MKTQLTDRDRNLLIALAVIVLLFLFIYVGMRPVFKSISSQKAEIEDAQDEKTINEEKVASLDTLRSYTEELGKKVNETMKDFYPMMTSDGIDKMLTGMALEYGVAAMDLSITMPKEGLSLSPYVYSAKALQSSSDEEASNSTVQVSTGICAASVTMKLQGDKDKLKEIIDTLFLDYPSIRMTAYSWSQATDTYTADDDSIVVNSYDVLVISMDIYMCEKDASGNVIIDSAEDGAETAEDTADYDTEETTVSSDSINPLDNEDLLGE